MKIIAFWLESLKFVTVYYKQVILWLCYGLPLDGQLDISLTHYGLVVLYGDTELGQHWLR